MITNSIWNERYRTTKLEDFVCNDEIRSKLQEYIQNSDIPHLLLAGRAGVGKTTLAKLLCENIDCDNLILNASDENGIDVIREKVKNFASSATFRLLKIIVLDEADYLTKEAQSALRNIIETFSQKTRFILTCNYREKIIDALQSRCVLYELEPPSKGIVAKKLVDILEIEKIKYQLEDVAKIVNKVYPDIRKSINLIQKYSSNGELKVETMITSDYIDEIFKVLNTTKNIKDIRQIIVDNNISDFSEIYRALYEKYFDNSNITIILGEGQFKGSFVVDKEINFMSAMIQVIKELNNKKIL